MFVKTIITQKLILNFSGDTWGRAQTSPGPAVLAAGLVVGFGSDLREE
jgi:hypothetical protein